MRQLLVGAPLLLAACHPQDWRAREIAAAEDKIRVEVDDPQAQFFQVQLTGDEATGQTCGYVKAKARPGLSSEAVRFVVYIDATAGPWVDKGQGRVPVSDEQFDSAWQNDCVKEGWKAG